MVDQFISLSTSLLMKVIWRTNYNLLKSITMKKILLILTACISIMASAQSTHQYASTEVATLLSDLKSASDGDIFELTTPGDQGTYNITSTSLEIHANVTIRAKDDLSSKPIVKHTANEGVDYIIRIKKNGKTKATDEVSFVLKGIKFEGNGTSTKYAIRTAKVSEHSDYSIDYQKSDSDFDGVVMQWYNMTIDDCVISDIKSGSDGRGMILYPGTRGTINITNTIFSNIERDAIDMYVNTTGTTVNGPWQFAEALNISNCTFYNLGREAILARSSGQSATPTSGADVITIDHCTFNNVGSSSTSYTPLRVDYADLTLTNSIFSNIASGKAYIIGSLKNPSTIDYIAFFNSSATENIKGGSATNIFSADPIYLDANNGDFTLNALSPYLIAASDAKALGDIRWTPSTSTAITNTKSLESTIYAHNNNIVINNNTEGLVTIFGLSGTIEVQQQVSSNATINVDLPTGIYIVKFTDSKNKSSINKITIK